jgi:peptidoglycan/LPS O-acetylase OafA/YrhL
VEAHPTKRAAPGRGEIRSLTGLRAVAATWVVLLHFQHLLAPFLDQIPALRTVISSGWLGVDLFFVLSGFVIGRSHLDKIGRGPLLPTIGRFLGSRFARVWPAWAVVTVLMFVWVWGMRRMSWNPDVLVPHADADAISLVRQLSMTHMWDRESFYGAGVLLPGWSVSAEWLAYLAFPLLALLLRPLRRLPAVVLLTLSCSAMLPLVVIAYGQGTVDHHQSWILRIACGFTAGLLAAMATRTMVRTQRTESLALAVSVLCVLGVVLVSLWNEWRRAGDLTHDYAGVAVAFFPLLVVSLSFTDRGVAKLLSGPVMVYGGRISYCLYLCHFVVLDVVVTMLWQQNAWVWTPKTVLLMPLLAVLPFGLAALLHRFVEEPGRTAVLRWLRITPRRAALPTTAPVPRQGGDRIPARGTAAVVEDRTDRLRPAAARTATLPPARVPPSARAADTSDDRHRRSDSETVLTSA